MLLYIIFFSIINCYFVLIWSSFMDRFQLRKAAGEYWLVDMEQNPFEYKNPLSVNEVGAYIWEGLQEGLNKGQIAGRLSKEYEVEEGVILQDIDVFLGQLAKFGVNI